MSNIIYAKVKFVRNLKGLKFAHKMTDAEQKDLLKLGLEATKACGLKCGVLSELSDGVIQNLISSGQIETSFVNNPINKGYASGEGVNVEIGGEDHIVISSKALDIFTSYSNAKAVDKNLCNKLNFAYSDKYGFLNPDIKKLGSGMSVEVQVLVPALSKLNAIKTLPKANEKLLFNIECLDKSCGLYLISTGATLGYTEKQICELTHAYIDKIIKLEIEASKELAKQDADDVLDASARAKAILNNCIKITGDEAYLLVGDILISINAGLEKDMSVDKLNKILETSQFDEKDLKNLAQNIQKILKN